MANETSAPVAPKTTSPAPARRTRRGFGTAFLLVALIATSIWAYTLAKENAALRDPEAQARQIVAAMRKHIILPESEVPGVFPIDTAQAKEPFFKNAQDGDLLVVYRSTQQAFIYSPSRNILVNAGVLVVNPEQEQVNAPEPEGPDESAEPAVSEEI